MCGIARLFLKDPSLEPQLGMLLSAMPASLTDRGPDSAGIAIYTATKLEPGKLPRTLNPAIVYFWER